MGPRPFAGLSWAPAPSCQRAVPSGSFHCGGAPLPGPPRYLTPPRGHSWPSPRPLELYRAEALSPMHQMRKQTERGKDAGPRSHTVIRGQVWTCALSLEWSMWPTGQNHPPLTHTHVRIPSQGPKVLMLLLPILQIMKLKQSEQGNALLEPHPEELGGPGRNWDGAWGRGLGQGLGPFPQPMEAAS